MRVAMIGAGYVGLVSAACLADFGHNVVCIDNDAAKIAALQRSEIPIFEPGLQDLVRSNVAEGRLSFAAELEAAVGSAEAIFIAVGTPARRGDGHADLSYLYEAAREVARAIHGSPLVIIKSTVPVGTGDEIERLIRDVRPDLQVRVASNPEFLREGAAIYDFKHPDRIVIGAPDEQSRIIMAKIYRPLSSIKRPFFTRHAERLSSLSTRQTLSWRRKSPSSMKWRIFAKKLVRMSKRLPAAWVLTTGLGVNFCMRVRDTAGPAFLKMSAL